MGDNWVGPEDNYPFGDATCILNPYAVECLTIDKYNWFGVLNKAEINGQINFDSESFASDLDNILSSSGPSSANVFGGFENGVLNIRGFTSNTINFTLTDDDCIQMEVASDSNECDSCPIYADFALSSSYAESASYAENTNSASYAGNADCANEVKVGEQVYDLNNSPKGVFSIPNDGTCTPISASDDFFIKSINGGGFDGNNTQEFTFASSSTHAVTYQTPIRITSGSSSSTNAGYIQTLKYNTTVLYNPSQAGNHNIITLKAPYATGIGSENTGPVSSSFVYCRVHHSAQALNVQRVQAVTTTFAWYRPGSDTVVSPNFIDSSTVEDVRIPSNQLIFNPGSITGSWDPNGNLVISLYHYNVANVTHYFDYELMGSRFFQT